MKTHFFATGELVRRTASRPAGYLQELEPCVVERKPGGIVCDVSCEAWRALRAKYAYERTAERHARDEKLAFIRQTCAGCRGCDFAKLSPCAQRKRLATAAGAKCVDVEGRTQLDLYASLEDPSFLCPENRF